MNSNGDSIPSKEARERISSLLRSARSTIHPLAKTLGPFTRQERRVGRPITQDEVAEACSISRQWYLSLEKGLAVKASVGVLDRIASVLMLSDVERSELFILAIPELATLKKGSGAGQGPQTVHFLGLTASRLWSAASEVEALSTKAAALIALIRPARKQDTP